MYPIPDDEDFTFFVGATLTQVCVGVHEVILRFKDDISVTIQTDVIHKNHAGEPLATYQAAREAGEKLIAFLGHAIRCTTAKSNSLTLEFSNDQSLELVDTSAQFESFVISYRGSVIVV